MDDKGKLHETAQRLSGMELSVDQDAVTFLPQPAYLQGRSRFNLVGRVECNFCGKSTSQVSYADEFPSTDVPKRRSGFVQPLANVIILNHSCVLIVGLWVRKNRETILLGEVDVLFGGD